MGRVSGHDGSLTSEELDARLAVFELREEAVLHHASRAGWRCEWCGVGFDHLIRVGSSRFVDEARTAREVAKENHGSVPCWELVGRDGPRG